MGTCKRIILGLTCVTGLLGVQLRADAQDLTYGDQYLADSVTVFFRTGKSAFDANFERNGERLDNFIKKAEQIKSLEEEGKRYVSLEGIVLLSGASPEGSLDLNTKLARQRQQAMLNYLKPRLHISDSQVQRSTDIIDWAYLRNRVTQDMAMPPAQWEATIKALETTPTSVNAFRKEIGEGAWNYLLKNHFPAMRRSSVVFLWRVEDELILPELKYDPIPDVDVPIPQFEAVDESAPKVARIPYKKADRQFIAKVNLMTLPLLVANGGVEYQPLEHFSVGLIAYYTALDWFTETIKFRVLGLQPEIRYWPTGKMMGFFAGAHATFGWYNIAVGGDWRYQDHQQKTPTFGGGVSVGYKIPLGKDIYDNPWGVEFVLGAGALPLHYDIYYNVHNGRLAGEDYRTYWGIDQAAISVTYRFGRYKVKSK